MLSNQSNGSNSFDDTIIPFLSNLIGRIHSLLMINRLNRSNGSHFTITITHHHSHTDNHPLRKYNTKDTQIPVCATKFDFLFAFLALGFTICNHSKRAFLGSFWLLVHRSKDLRTSALVKSISLVEYIGELGGC
ncbi:hypothetical protein L6452_27584 [Arctium lappa]|uniref:Uncharacterized protein n=1 Tax=Arctium lappa TaxID=4217 RepID=A0ACB9A0T3_ARCLA|nr:hypothetical protein L6452_27584 [Arctium lappa]